MNRYYFTDFKRYEQKLINELRNKGYFVYGVRSTNGIHYTIEKKVLVNNIGFLITDTELPLHKGYLTDTELEKLGWDESLSLYDEMKKVSESISTELLMARREWEKGEKQRKALWDEAVHYQNNRMERDRHYNLSLRKDNPVVSNGYGVRFQTIYNNGDGTQKVMYFITDPSGKIIVDSTTENFRFNARYKNMASKILVKHGIPA